VSLFEEFKTTIIGKGFKIIKTNYGPADPPVPTPKSTKVGVDQTPRNWEESKLYQTSTQIPILSRRYASHFLTKTLHQQPLRDGWPIDAS